MTKLLHSVFLISGTAIGSGVIALPLAATNIGFFNIFIIILVAFFVAYQTSLITANLIKKSNKYISIGELSLEFSGRKAFYISTLSFYILSISLLSVYFAGIVDISKSFININDFFAILLCSLLFLMLFSFKMKMFNNINSILFLILIFFIISVIFANYQITGKNTIIKEGSNLNGILYFLPIVFTSFGVQNVCPHVCKILEMDMKLIKKAFIIGISIPAIIYIFWIYVVLQSIYEFDPMFFEKILSHQVNAGSLIEKLCEFSNFKFMKFFFKILTLFAIITSAAGMGIGLIYSLKSKANKYTYIVLVGIPAICAYLIPNAFMSILSFGAIIATVFVIFVPLYLMFKVDKKESLKFKYIFCAFYGVLIILSELFG